MQRHLNLVALIAGEKIVEGQPKTFALTRKEDHNPVAIKFQF